ncbi:MAG: transcription antitermination factor NusB [Candidatus Cloacimonetes bacterium]|nr:transcription antitermination factor NusB [Candidatus Cloacimonadota bacterium]
MGSRRESREIAVQTLYALCLDSNEFFHDSANSSKHITEKLSQIIDFNKKLFSDSQNEFCNFLVNNTYQNLESIDDLITKFSEHWDIRRISIMDKCVLRMAIMEMRFTDTPSKIIINEAIEISKKFCGEKSGKFINGILDSVMHSKDSNDKM